MLGTRAVKSVEKHHGETEGHVERLEQVFALLEKKPQGKTCAAINGITDEGAEIMTEYKGTPALDAGLLAAAQAVEHYEISRYGTLRTWAEELGLDEAVTLFQETLDEEKATDKALTDLAKTVVNQEAEGHRELATVPPRGSGIFPGFGSRSVWRLSTTFRTLEMPCA